MKVITPALATAPPSVRSPVPVFKSTPEPKTLRPVIAVRFLSSSNASVPSLTLRVPFTVMFASGRVYVGSEVPDSSKSRL